MNYSHLYVRLIDKARNRSRPLVTERHHIIPKSMGGNNKTENLVWLTPREHFVAHHLLWKIHRTPGMALAFKMMRSMHGLHINAKEYQKIQAVTRQHLSKLGKAAHLKGAGIHGLPPEVRRQNSRPSLGGKATVERKLGPHGWTQEKKKAHSSQIAKSRSRERQLADAENLNRVNAAKTPEERAAISQHANCALKNQIKEKWEATLIAAGLPVDFKPTAREAKTHGLKFYWGAVCQIHPEQEGKRHISSRSCVVSHL